MNPNVLGLPPTTFGSSGPPAALALRRRPVLPGVRLHLRPGVDRLPHERGEGARDAHLVGLDRDVDGRGHLVVARRGLLDERFERQVGDVGEPHAVEALGVHRRVVGRGERGEAQVAAPGVGPVVVDDRGRSRAVQLGAVSGRDRGADGCDVGIAHPCRRRGRGGARGADERGDDGKGCCGNSAYVAEIGRSTVGRHGVSPRSVIGATRGRRDTSSTEWSFSLLHVPDRVTPASSDRGGSSRYAPIVVRTA